MLIKDAAPELATMGENTTKSLIVVVVVGMIPVTRRAKLALQVEAVQSPYAKV